MKNKKALHKIMGCGVVLLAVFVFAGTGYSRTPCNRCQSCEQSPRYTPPPSAREYAELEYRDGFPGPRIYKRRQVEKLQCMLRVLGYCSGPVDGWYGHSTARAVMLFLADNFQEIGYGKKIDEYQWNYLVSRAGSRCGEYDREDTSPYRYNEYQDRDRERQERERAYREEQEQQYQERPYQYTIPQDPQQQQLYQYQY